MAKYHIRKDGLPGECKAKTGNCPLGSDDEHYSNKMEAILASEEKMREEGNFLVSVKKHPIFHVSAAGAVEECKFRDGYCEVQPFDKFNNLHSADHSVIDGAARAFREAVGAEEPPPAQSFVGKDADEPEDGLADWERDLLSGADPTFAPPPNPTPTPRRAPARKPPASDPITQEAQRIRNDGYDRYRNQGWTEQEIQEYRDSCGHSMPARFRSKPAYRGC